ncbi:MAG: hypothetical protein AB7K52_10430 [Phycisphaerales bacterium]
MVHAGVLVAALAAAVPAHGSDGVDAPVGAAWGGMPIAAAVLGLEDPEAAVENLPMHITRGGPDTSMYERPIWTILPYVSYEGQARSNLQGDGGSLRVDRFAAGGNLIVGPEKDLQISIIFNYERSNYRLRGARLAPGGTQLLSDVDAYDFIPNFELRLGPDWGVFGGGILAWAGEDGADFGDSARYGGFGGVRWLISDKLNFALGLTVITRLEEDVSVFPIIGIEWEFAEHWRLLTEGPGVKLEYDPTDYLILRLRVAYNTREYRLDEANPAMPSGIFRDASVPITFGADFVPHPFFSLSAFVGFTAYQQLQIDNFDGVRFAHPQVKPGLVFGVSVQLQF